MNFVEILLTLLGILASLPICLILYRSYQGYSYYRRAVKVFGKNNVAFINRSYMGYGAFNKANAQHGLDSASEFNDEIKKNPDVKIVILAHFEYVNYMVCDPEMIKQVAHEYSRNYIEKFKRTIFADSVAKGLLLARGDAWKKSRTIMSNLFHFDILKKNESIMYDVVGASIQNLHDKDEVDLFKLGRTIGGEVVIESLLGKDFTKMRIGENIPADEIQQLLGDLYTETINPLCVIRHALFGLIEMDSKYLLPSQKVVRDRMNNVKNVGVKYLQQQKEKQKKGEPISAFVEAYLNLNDESCYDDVVQQLITFLIAGMDTTG